MDSVEGKRRIVVGIDGSPSSRNALRWAVREGELIRSTIEVLTAWEMPVTGWSTGVLDGQFAQRAERVLDECVDEVLGGSRCPVDVKRTIRCGNASQVLIDATGSADLLVVGSRGLGGFSGTLLGSVGQHCAQHAKCPVVIVRGPSDSKAT